jgi:hypothetical protein
MFVSTEKITGELLSNGIKRYDSPMYDSNAGYSEGNGKWLIIDESYSIQDTDHLIEDCIIGEHYKIAAIIKRYVDNHKER